MNSYLCVSFNALTEVQFLKQHKALMVPLQGGTDRHTQYWALGIVQLYEGVYAADEKVTLTIPLSLVHTISVSQESEQCY